MASRIGNPIKRALRERDNKMPNGNPRMTATVVATSMRASVCMASSHNPKTPMRKDSIIKPRLNSTRRLAA